MDNITSQDILNNREEKNNEILAYLDNYQVVSLKANTPGLDKNTKDAHILISIFSRILDSTLNTKKVILDGYDGRMVLYLVNKNTTRDIKKELVEIEDNHPLGRLVDIDVYKDEIPESRGTLRKCYVCDNPAFVCARNNSHTQEELLSTIHAKLKLYLRAKIEAIIDYSMESELCLSPKFGLVCINSNGSHNDMDYYIMHESRKPIINGFIRMFEYAYESESIKDIFSNIREIGKDTEKEMYQVTNGINAYKGLIFILGITISAFIYALRHQMNVFEVIKKMTKDIYDDFNDVNNINTFGYYAYQTYNIKGVREEVHNGLLNVRSVLEYYSLDTSNSKHLALAYLISNVSDTVLLKRCKNIELYNEVKEKFKSFTIDKLEEYNDYCLKKGLSFGGSADLLVVSIFLNELNKIIKIY